MCGVAVRPVYLNPLIHYSMLLPEGFAIQKTCLPSLQIFLTTRMYLYSNVYYHRTTRAIDIHLREIFGETLRDLFPDDPRKDLDAYLRLTDWSLLEEVRTWPRSRHPRRQRLGHEWARILGRNVKWRMAYATVIKDRGQAATLPILAPASVEERIRAQLPSTLRDLPFRVDMALLDPRPDPKDHRAVPLYVFDPSTRVGSIDP